MLPCCSSLLLEARWRVACHFWWKFDALTRKKGPATRHQQPEDEKDWSRFPDVLQHFTTIYSILKKHCSADFILTFLWQAIEDKPEITVRKRGKQDWCTTGNCYSFAFKKKTVWVKWGAGGQRKHTVKWCKSSHICEGSGWACICVHLHSAFAVCFECFFLLLHHFSTVSHFGKWKKNLEHLHKIWYLTMAWTPWA